MIVLDTHIWLWWLNGDAHLSLARRQQIEQADKVCVSAISCFEVAWLVQHQRIILPLPIQDWLTMALAPSGVTLQAISPEIAITAVGLTEHHSDPQDRLIIATALQHQALLMSDDGKFAKYQELAGRLI